MDKKCVSQNLETKENRMTYSYENILKKSSISVLSFIGHSETKSKKIFWMLVLILCTSGCVVNICDFIRAYFEYPVLNVLDVQTNFRSQFPAVTVCNLNRVDREYTHCIKYAQNWYDCDDYDQGLRALPASETKKIFTLSQSNITSWKILYEESSSILNGFSELDMASKQIYGYSFDYFIEKCTFQSKKCDQSNFTYFYNLQYGNCYTFHSLKEKDAVSQYSYTGPNYGLELAFNVLSDTYLDITDSIGIRITVHSPYEDPNPSVDGINIAPGFESIFALSTTSIKRLPAPYRDRCLSYDETSVDPFLKNQHSCITACIQLSNNINCSCVDPLLPNFGFNRSCSLKNESELFCLNKVMNDIREKELPCLCPLPCFYTDFKVDVSTSTLTEKTKYGSKIDAAKVKIYFSNLDHVTYSQKPAYSEMELLSHLGGILALWLGLSMMAIIEIIEHFYLAVKYFFNLKL